jgi:WD40 repeat protein
LVQFSPDGKRVVTALDDQTAGMWDAVSGKPIGQPMKHSPAAGSAHRHLPVHIQPEQLSPDGQRVVTASDGNARVWDASSGKAIGEPMWHEGTVLSAQFSPDGQRVMTTSEDNSMLEVVLRMVRLWDAASCKPISEPIGWLNKGGVDLAQFSPDGQRLLTTSSDHARLWDASSGKAIGEPMKYKYGVHSAQFSPDGQRVVTASHDHTKRLWDAASGKPIGEPMKHDSFVESAQISPDGQRV